MEVPPLIWLRDALGDIPWLSVRLYLRFKVSGFHKFNYSLIHNLRTNTRLRTTEYPPLLTNLCIQSGETPVHPKSVYRKDRPTRGCRGGWHEYLKSHSDRIFPLLHFQIGDHTKGPAHLTNSWQVPSSTLAHFVCILLIRMLNLHFNLTEYNHVMAFWCEIHWYFLAVYVENINIWVKFTNVYTCC